jgi:hypothetical protein
MVRPPAKQGLAVRPPDPVQLLYCLLRRPRLPPPPPCSTHDFGCTPRGALGSTCASRSPDVHNSGRATHGSDVLALPTTLLVSPLGCAGATGTASTSTVTASKGRTGGSSDHPSSDDHTGVAGFLASGRQTHPVGHYDVNLFTGVLLRPCHPGRSKLALRHGRRIYCLDCQQHLGSCPSLHWLQRHHWQVNFQSQV